MKSLWIPSLVLIALFSPLALAEEETLEQRMTLEQERELSGRQLELERRRGDEAAEDLAEELDDEMDAPYGAPAAGDIDPVPPINPPDAPDMLPPTSPVPAPRLPGEPIEGGSTPDSGQ